MKIAQVAPLMESVPPKLYGGTERVVSYLTEELVKQGHDVTLFASGDSVTAARLEPVVGQALRLEEQAGNSLKQHLLLLDRVARMADRFDIIHFHFDCLHYPLVRAIGIRCVTTLHGRLDLPDLIPFYREFKELPVVSISNHQRTPLPFVNWCATVYNGIPEELYHFHAEPAGYLAFLGRISPEKRPDRAIEIAVRAGMEIRIAAKVDEVDRDYFEDRIRPLLRHPLVTFLGEIGEREKDEFLGGAVALLFPVDWPEPFGLGMIEAMACGTPVIAYRQGAVPEVMEEGVTGFIVDNLRDAVSAVKKVGEISRDGCRRVFKERFTAQRMAEDYLAVYQSVPDRRDRMMQAV